VHDFKHSKFLGFTYKSKYLNTEVESSTNYFSDIKGHY